MLSLHTSRKDVPYQDASQAYLYLFPDSNALSSHGDPPGLAEDGQFLC